MRGHIRKRGSTYCIVVDLGQDPSTGKRQQKWFSGFKNKKQAEEKLPEILIQVQSGERFENKDLKISDYLNDWLNIYAKHNVSPKTYIFYHDIISKVLIKHLGSIQISKLKPMQIQSFLSNILSNSNLSSTTVKHYYNVLNIALNQAVKWQIINTNPCIGVEPPKVSDKDLNVLNYEQVIALLNYTKTSIFNIMYIPILLAVTCGMRRGEILGLKWEDVDFKNDVLHIKSTLQMINNEFMILPTKTDLSKRSIALLPTTSNILKALEKEHKIHKLSLGPDYKDNGFICCWPDGRPLRPDYVTKTLKKLVHKCNLPDIRFHDLRHTHATLLLLEGINPKVVSERLGHSKVDMTLDTYSHVLPQMQKEAAEKLDNILFKTQ